MKTIHKILHPFDQDLYDNGRHYPVFIHITSERGYLSFTGVQSPLPSGNARGGCGQIDMEYDHADKMENDTRYDNPTPVSELRFCKGWNAGKWYELLHLWNAWHLRTEVPDTVIDYLNTLPSTDKTPAWI